MPTTCLRVGAQRHCSAHQLPHHAAGQPKHCGLVDGRVLVQHSLHLGGCSGRNGRQGQRGVLTDAGAGTQRLAAGAQPTPRRAPGALVNLVTVSHCPCLTRRPLPAGHPPLGASQAITHCTRSRRPPGACPFCGPPPGCSQRRRRWPGRPSCGPGGRVGLWVAPAADQMGSWSLRVSTAARCEQARRRRQGVQTSPANGVAWARPT